MELYDQILKYYITTNTILKVKYVFFFYIYFLICPVSRSSNICIKHIYPIALLLEQPKCTEYKFQLYTVTDGISLSTYDLAIWNLEISLMTSSQEMFCRFLTRLVFYWNFTIFLHFWWILCCMINIIYIHHAHCLRIQNLYNQIQTCVFQIFG